MGTIPPGVCWIVRQHTPSAGRVHKFAVAHPGNVVLVVQLPPFSLVVQRRQDDRGRGCPTRIPSHCGRAGCERVRCRRAAGLLLTCLVLAAFFLLLLSLLLTAFQKVFNRGLHAELRSALGLPEHDAEAVLVQFEDPEVGVREYASSKYVFPGSMYDSWEWMCIPGNGCAFLGMAAYSWEWLRIPGNDRAFLGISTYSQEYYVFLGMTANSLTFPAQPQRSFSSATRPRAT